MWIVVEAVIDSQGKIDHPGGFGNHLGTAAETGQEVSDIAVVLFDGEGQVLAREVLLLGDRSLVALPVIGDEGLALDPDLVEEFLEGLVVTATQHPGEGAAGNGIVCAPDPPRTLRQDDRRTA